ncbi:hypothetical protein AC1031_003499 [Aphanomyces cochlioides]|nr:hypothetical protein AC1031_003499 [Aphanomyces cochlioides]
MLVTRCWLLSRRKFSHDNNHSVNMSSLGNLAQKRRLRVADRIVDNHELITRSRQVKVGCMDETTDDNCACKRAWAKFVLILNVVVQSPCKTLSIDKKQTTCSCFATHLSCGHERNAEKESYINKLIK